MYFEKFGHLLFFYVMSSFRNVTNISLCTFAAIGYMWCRTWYFCYLLNISNTCVRITEKQQHPLLVSISGRANSFSMFSEFQNIIYHLLIGLGLVVNIFPTTKKNGAHWLSSFLYSSLPSNSFLFLRINFSHFLVFGNCGDLAAMLILANIVRHVWMLTVQVYKRLPCSHMSDND